MFQYIFARCAIHSAASLLRKGPRPSSQWRMGTLSACMWRLSPFRSSHARSLATLALMGASTANHARPQGTNPSVPSGAMPNTRKTTARTAPAPHVTSAQSKRRASHCQTAMILPPKSVYPTARTPRSTITACVATARHAAFARMQTDWRIETSNAFKGSVHSSAIRCTSSNIAHNATV